MRARPLAAAAFFCLLSACSANGDKAAKKRVFSPEDPPQARLAAQEPIDVDKLADDAALADRVLTMGAEEAFERMGAFRYSATASFEWVFGRESVGLVEKRSLDLAAARHYALHTENSRDYGLDIVRLPDRAFARSRYHNYRERVRDRGQSEKMREDVFGALRSAAALLDNRLALAGGKREDVAGRAARRFQLGLAKQPRPPREAQAVSLPPLAYPAGGPDPGTKRRADFAAQHKPVSVEGSLWVDAQTGVPLKVDLAATIRAPGEEKVDATLVLKVQSDLKPSSSVFVAAPEEYQPDEARPNGIAAALERFEIQRTDGGIVAAPAPARPAKADEAEPEE